MPAELWPWLLVLGGAAGTYLWRGTAVMLAGRIRRDSEIFVWVGCVAYSMLAGLIARIILLPTGPLAETALVDRLAACAIAAAVFFLSRRNMLLGVGTGVGALILLSAIRLPLP